jgi:hypothetical protein
MAIFMRRRDEWPDDSPQFGATLGLLLLGVLGGAVAEKALTSGGGGSSSAASPAPALTNTIGGTPPPSPTAGVASGQAASQAAIAAQKQRKRAAAGDTLLTPVNFGTQTPIASLTPKTLMGSGGGASAPRTLLG